MNWGASIQNWIINHSQDGIVSAVLGFEDFEFPIETHWQGDNVGEFEKICDGARRINILHGHYTPMKAIVNNKDKIHSNIVYFRLHKVDKDLICNMKDKGILFFEVSPNRYRLVTHYGISVDDIQQVLDTFKFLL